MTTIFYHTHTCIHCTIHGVVHVAVVHLGTLVLGRGARCLCGTTGVAMATR